MPDYGLYKLSNSTEVPRYPGSIVPELIKVAGVQQEKYDASVYSDELLQQALDTSQVREADMPVYKALYDEMAARMKERAAKGDYENMVRETNRDARTFAQRFAPIAENRKREQAYQEELDKMIASGKVTRAKADEARRYSKFFDKGLTYDPATGQYKGQFSGYIPGEDVDLSDFVHKALQGINPRVFGSDVRYDNGKFYRQVGGKSTVLTMDELWPHVEAYAKTDPKFQSYLQEQQMFKSYRFADEERLRKNLDPMDYDRLRQEANTLGVSVGEMLQTKARTGATKDIYDTLYNLTSKYQRNDKESWDKNMGETEQAGRDAAKKDEVTFGGLIQVNLPGSSIATPADALNMTREAENGANTVRQRVSDFVTTNGIKPGPNGTFVDSANRDRTIEMNNLYGNLRQQQATANDLKERDDKIRKDVGFIPDKELLEKAEAARNRVLNSGEVFRDPEGIKQRAADAAAEVLADHPRYKAYKEALAKNAENQTISVGIQRFQNPKANKAAEELVSTLQQDLGLKRGALGLEDMQGNPLKDEDYDAMIAKTSFGGYYKSPSDGQYRLVFKVGDVRYNSKGQPVGEPRLVQMKAGPDVLPYLQKTGEVNVIKDYIGNEVVAMEQTPGKQTTFTLPGAVGTATIRRIEAHEANLPHIAPGAKYMAEYTVNGEKKVATFTEPGQLVGHVYETSRRWNEELEKLERKK